MNLATPPPVNSDNQPNDPDDSPAPTEKGPEDEDEVARNDENEEDHDLSDDLRELGVNLAAVRIDPFQPAPQNEGDLANGENDPTMTREALLNSESRRLKSQFSKIAYSKYYEGAAIDCGPGVHFLNQFDKDGLNSERIRTRNPYYPLKDFKEWEFTSVLLRMHCSQAEKNELLNTQLVSAL